MFNTRNLSVHQRKRKYVNPAFSARNLQDFEEHMAPSILRLVRSMQQCVVESKPFDFPRWCKRTYVWSLRRVLNHYSKLLGIRCHWRIRFWRSIWIS